MRVAILVSMLWSLAACGSMATTAAAADASRQDLARQRAEIQARHEHELAACAGRFDLNACQGEARSRQRQALADVQARQQRLDEARRSEKSLQRQAEVARKQAEVDRRNSLAPPQDPPSPAPKPPPVPPKREARAASSSSAAKAAERAAAAQKRRQEIEADQARIDARVARRAGSGKKVMPLPPAPGASGPT